MSAKIHPKDHPDIRRRIAEGETRVSVAALYRVSTRAIRHILSGDVRGLRAPTPESYEDLLRQTVRTESGCLEWTGAMRGNYGTVCVEGIRQPVHRLAWGYVRGPFPYAKHVCHTCRNRKCINIEHLYLSDVNDNSQCRRSGSKHHNAKLTDERAMRIYRRATVLKEKWSAIADDEGVSGTTVSSIAHKRTWKRIHKSSVFRSESSKRAIVGIIVDRKTYPHYAR